MMRALCALALTLTLAVACGAEEEARALVVLAGVDAGVANRASLAPLEGTVASGEAVEVAGATEATSEAVDVVSLAALLGWGEPIDGRITSPFGPRDRDDSFHDAIDLAAAIGSKVVAPTKLRIRTVAYQARAGRYIVADVVNDDGVVEWRLTFAHLSQVAVFEGDTIARGETLGLIGLSGSASGAHLHFRIEAIAGSAGGAVGARVAIDPLAAIPSLGT